jgi:hypothetical protein
MLALQDNLKKFELQNGPIKMNHGNEPQMPPFSFGGGHIPQA